MKKFLLMLCCAAMCAGFAGCSDNDDDEGAAAGSSSGSLTGRWSCYKYEDWYSGQLIDSGNEFGEGIGLYILEFNAGGKGREFGGVYMSQLSDASNWDGFTYTRNGSKLIIRYNDGYVDEYNVSSVTSSELVLSYQDEDEGLIYTEKLFFRRM